MPMHNSSKFRKPLNPKFWSAILHVQMGWQSESFSILRTHREQNCKSTANEHSVAAGHQRKD